jgi:hypothetical protein
METFMVTFMVERKSKNLPAGQTISSGRRRTRGPTKHQFRGFMVPTMKG